MRRSTLLFVALLSPLIIFSSLASSSTRIRLPSGGSVSDSPQDDYYSLWIYDYRVETGFFDYLDGSTFDFSGFFNHLYSEFLQELETTVFGEGYESNPVAYGSPTYVPGEPVGNLESIANYVLYQGANGVVYYKDQSGNIFGDGDTNPNEINDAISATPSGGIVFIKVGNYTLDSSSIVAFSKTNLIIAGEGWDTVLQMAGGVNQYVMKGGYGGCQNVIIRDLTIDGNRVNNPHTEGSAALEIRGMNENILLENVQVLHARQFGIDAWDSSRIYTINSVSIDSGWNTFEYTRCTWSAAIGNYMQDTRDVAMSTWASNNLVFANNVAVYGIHDGLGYNDANWGIGAEPQEGANPIDTYNLIFKNNICSEHNQAGSDEPWKGTGLWVTGSHDGIGGSYNITIDGNICENNNRAGILIANDEKYPDGSSIVVCNNRVRGNNRYNQTGSIYGDIVILREGVIHYNNTIS